MLAVHHFAAARPGRRTRASILSPMEHPPGGRRLRPQRARLALLPPCPALRIRPLIVRVAHHARSDLLPARRGWLPVRTAAVPSRSHPGTKRPMPWGRGYLSVLGNWPAPAQTLAPLPPALVRFLRLLASATDAPGPRKLLLCSGIRRRSACSAPGILGSGR